MAVRRTSHEVDLRATVEYVDSSYVGVVRVVNTTQHRRSIFIFFGWADGR